MALMRLDKFFSSQNLCSRKEMKALLKDGSITVNGRTDRLKGDLKIDTDKDVVRLHGEIVEYKQYVYLMLNKPQGVVSATNDREHKTVLDLVPPELYRPGLFPAGRLDKDTTGFVLLTDDGDFAHRILSPKNHVEKTYHARLDGKIAQEDIERFAQGVTLKDGFVCLPARMRVLEDTEQPLVEIVICEGKYHQIKRMAGAIGRKVLSLKRVKMGNVELDPDLPEGACKAMLHKDVERFL